jgi:hypothetical protein
VLMAAPLLLEEEVVMNTMGLDKSLVRLGDRGGWEGVEGMR